MDNEQQVATTNVEYSESEYEDDANEHDEFLRSVTASDLSKQHQSISSPDKDATKRRNATLNWRQSAISNQNINDTERYLRWNGFELRSSFGYGSSESYSPPSQTPASSVISDQIHPLLRSPLHKRASLQFSTTPNHHRQNAIDQGRSSSSPETRRQSYSEGEHSRVHDSLAPPPLNMPSITATKRAGSTHQSRKPTLNSPQLPHGNSRTPPQRLSTTLSQSSEFSFDALDEELLDRTSKRTNRNLLPTQSILSVTDLRPAQVTRDPSHILHFQVIPKRTTGSTTTGDLQELSTDYSLGQYVADSRPLISTVAPPPQANTTKKKEPKVGRKALFRRFKQTLAIDKKK